MRFSVLVASIIAGYVSSTPHDDWRYQQVANKSTSASSVSGQIELPGEQRICECRITASGSSPSVIFSGIPCAAVGGRECFSEIGNSISVRSSILLALVLPPGLSFMPQTSAIKRKKRILRTMAQCVTSGAAWTDEQCREWGGNPVDNRVYRAVCRTYNGGGCPA
jgi:hypothetical protein